MKFQPRGRGSLLLIFCILRPSGNAPEMRCYVEAADADAASRLLIDGLDLIRRVSARSPSPQ
jgi:phosphomannomutase